MPQGELKSAPTKDLRGSGAGRGCRYDRFGVRFARGTLRLSTGLGDGLKVRCLERNPVAAMMEKRQPRLWRVLLWGTVAFLLFSVLVWLIFSAYIKFEAEKPEAVLSRPPTPLLPSIVAGTLALVILVLALFGLWWLQARRKPLELRPSFASHKGNSELFAWLLLLTLLLAASLSIPEHSHIATGRCSLFTLDDACGHAPFQLPTKGFYYFVGGAGTNAGIYAKGDHGRGPLGLDKFAFEQIQAERSRFGWPLKAVTLDVVPQQSSDRGAEWHIVFEVYVVGNLTVAFPGWVVLQVLIHALRWSFRLG